MADPKPLVSAVIPTHNRASLLKRALESVCAQEYAPIETVVVDDGSTDNTPAVIDSFRDRLTMRSIRNEVARGAPKARNRGIEAATGTLVAGLDDDDEWHPARLSALVAQYDASYAFITSDITFEHAKSTLVWKKKEIIDLNTLLYTNQVGNQGLIARERLLAVNGFDEELEAAQDYDLWLRLCSAYGPVKNVQRPLQIVHTEHEQHRISNPTTQLRGYVTFYKKHKHRMNRAQRKYQLYMIRRAQQKPESWGEFFSCVPRWRYAKEVRRWIAARFYKE